MTDVGGILRTGVQVITVNVGAAVAAADAAEGGDGVSVAVTVAETEKAEKLHKEQKCNKLSRVFNGRAIHLSLLTSLCTTCTSLCCLSYRVPSPPARRPLR